MAAADAVKLQMETPREMVRKPRVIALDAPIDLVRRLMFPRISETLGAVVSADQNEKLAAVDRIRTANAWREDKTGVETTPQRT